ncbi:MAG: DNA cytosine methyltransferase [Phenylobacterium sp.]|nr:DNA cytosine methyltransferase [Phenylobacterium sp.]
MPRRKILVADLLCGAGGSSTGCERALRDLGLEMELVCVNHWQTAIDTHRLNHPEARHVVQDIATARPHLLVPEGYLDLLMASPTCTHHSVARGGKPTSDQQRSDPWHIITWLTELRVKRLIIENVWEFTGWGPVDPRTGKPIPSRKGEYFRAWIDTLRRLGFDPEWRKLNAADYGDATTRQRFILMARSDRKSVHWPTPTHAKVQAGGSLALFPTVKPWRPAREIIDWDLKGRSIFGRKKPLAAKTLARIYAGAVKFRWPEPYLVILRNHMAAQGLDGPLPALTAGGTHIGLAEPVILNLKKGTAPSSLGAPLPTQATHAALATAEAILLSPHNTGAPRSAAEPLATITTGGAGSEVRPGCARPMLVEPFVVNGRRNNEPRGVEDEPIPTLDTKGGVWLAEPFVLSQGAGGAPRSTDAPVPTIPTGGAHALISPYYGSGSGETCASDADPLPTVTTKGRLGVVVPVTQSGGGAAARSVDDPVPTMTTAKGGEFAVVMPVTHHDGSGRVRDVADPLPTVTGANRGELAFITAQHGERPGQAPRVHSVDAPAPTIAATGHVDLVAGVEGYDILFRMLEPHELAAAMGFNDEDRAYALAGTKTDQIKQIGNAVSVAKMKACVGAIMADAAPKRRIEGEVPTAIDRREVA